MDISKLNKRVRFENPVNVNDTQGGQDTTGYTQWAEAWASVEKKSGFKNFSEGFEAAVSRYDIYVRWRTLIENNINKNNTRIIYDSKRFGIDSMELVNEKKKYYHFTVTAVE